MRCIGVCLHTTYQLSCEYVRRFLSSTLSQESESEASAQEIYVHVHEDEDTFRQ